MENEVKIFREICTTISFQTLLILALLMVLQAGNATAVYVTSPASTAVISIDPVLPKQGESFVINVTGQWRDRCIPDQSELTYEIREFMESARPELRQVLFQLKTTLLHANECGGEFEPTAYKLSVPVQSTNWDALSVTVDINQSPNLDRHVNWRRNFDLVLGTHDINPRLESGYWISEETPYQGLLIQQQGDTVVFYDMTYNRTSGEPNWIYADGVFHGNSLNGVGYFVSWLSPVEGATLGYKDNPDLDPNIISYYRLVQPEDPELTFDATSAGITVRGVNRIDAFVGLHDVDGEPQAVYHTYKPWVFRLDDSQLPPVVPDMIGVWNLYGFNGQYLEQSHAVSFNAGTKIGNDEYRFSTIDEEWLLECQIDLNGEGDCTLTNDILGLSMNYYLNKTPLDPNLGYFNGNYTKAPLVSSNSEVPDQTGILIRSGVHLPVLSLK